MLIALVPLSNAGAFTPPIGIPAPPFPADLDVARPSPPSPWTSETAGNYYVERSASGCSDSRTYGTPTLPRCSLPSSPAAGSKVFVNGTYSAGGNVSWTGTSANPIWLLSYSDSNKPLFTGTSPNPISLTGSYIIVDGMRHDLQGQTNDNFGMYGSNIMVRNSSFRNTFGNSGGCGINVAGTNQVVYQNTIYDQGDWQFVGADIDRHGFKISPPTNGLWILDSLIYHNQGDGVQVGDQNNTSSQINRVFVGRVTSYENLQSCLWTKNATDVVFSQNTCYNITTPGGSSSGDGQAMGGQYDAKYVWFLANRIYNTKNGIKIQSSSDGGGGPWYAIGNVINNVKAGTCDPYGNGGLSTRNTGGFYVFYNTVYDVDSFVSMVHSNAGTVRNNIFAAKSGSCDAINGFDGSFTIDYNLYDSASYPVGFNGASYSNLSGFSSSTGQETHRVVGNPLFVSPPSNFALQSTSVAVDSANPTEEAAFATYQSRYGVDIRKDFVGTARPLGARWDMGAYEYDSGVVLRSPNPPTNLQIQ